MPRTSAASGRLAKAMEDRRIELRLRWTDVAQRGETTTESIYQARMGRKKIGPATEAAIERGLGWQRGSMQAIRDGGDPTPLPYSTPPPGITAAGPDAAAVATTLHAIEADPNLLPEAKEHLLNQYRLLLRLNAPAAAAAAVQAYDEETERRIATNTTEILADRSMTPSQKERLIGVMESEERARAAVTVFDGRRNPHLDVRFEESGDDDLSEDEAAAALAEESQVRERQTNGC